MSETRTAYDSLEDFIRAVHALSVERFGPEETGTPEQLRAGTSGGLDYAFEIGMSPEAAFDGFVL